jgi:hypothetical protein
MKCATPHSDIDECSNFLERAKAPPTRPAGAGTSRSGRLDLNQRPLGPQPDRSRAWKALLAYPSHRACAQVSLDSLSLDPVLDPAGPWDQFDLELSLGCVQHVRRGRLIFERFDHELGALAKHRRVQISVAIQVFECEVSADSTQAAWLGLR